MNTQTLKKSLLTIALAAALCGAPAFAGPGGRSALHFTGKQAGRAVRNMGAMSAASRSVGRSLSRMPSNRNSGFSRNDAFRGLAGALGNGFGNPYGNFFGNPYGGNGYGRNHHDEFADAYRDAAIANAVVGLVGVIANAACQPRPVAVAAPAYAAAPVYAAAPAYAAAPVVVQPAGHYEVRRTLVQEGYYENTQVWVPEYNDPATGTIVAGHYETHKRFVPPVYQETQVWVAP